ITARVGDRVACPPEVSPTFSEVRPIAYSLGSAFAQRARQKYRLGSGKCDLSPSLGVRRIA
ncbi:hypothetical protein, partial [Limnospira sp. PMC 289.06]|uniref:hypothetical protein n=1 Tax=Limnospira sp. PMC 289.06 TaxID=2981094 RepID=UPI0028E0D08D|nr:hypothetical protein [Limnospira sp. PMC 289.06]